MIRVFKILSYTIIVVGKEDVQDPITPLKDTTITRDSLSTFLS